MKVSIVCASCKTPAVQQILENVKDVLQELEIEIEYIELEGIPYYKEEELSPLAQVIANKLSESKGVIAITSVQTVGMHSSMQSFFEHMERYTELINRIPMLVIPYTTSLGERQVAYQMLQTWNMFGGIDGGYVALNSSTPVEIIKVMVEKAVEGFYRLLRQERITYNCSEAIARDVLNGKVGAISSNLGEIRSLENRHIDLSTQEQNIQEFASLLKSQISHEEEEEFFQTNTSTYGNPRMGQKQVAKPKPASELSRLPHYFLAQYAKDLELTIQYIVSNTRQQGYLTIKEGDCTYEEGTVDQAALEITLTEELLQQLMTKKITYQKAFMVGKIKVKGNFVLLPKLDQIFKEV